MMNRLSNMFSILNLDAEDDTEQTSTCAAVRDTKESKDIATRSVIKTKGKLAFKREKESQNYESNQRSLASTLEEYTMPLVWIDLEMTGLDVEVDRILEIACIVTDGKLTKSVEGPNLVIRQSKECLDNMGEWCRNHHAASGLTERVLKSTTTEQDAEKQVTEFVKKFVGDSTPLLAGNSIYVDFQFIKKYMPNLAGIFPHVLVDVSSVMALCIRWFPKEKRRAPSKEKKHRALDDIKESIKELKYYKESIFKPQHKSKN